MTTELLPTKNPVIFVHGLFGFGELNVWSVMKLRYWRGVEDALRERKVKVGAPSLGPVSSIKERAERLHLFLEKNFPNQNVNLIGFSMGGLDCRYLITHIKKKSYKILSLATVATPHRGSSFMDFMRDILGVGHLSSYVQIEKNDHILNSVDKEFIQTLLNHTTPQKYLTKILKPIDAPAFTNLTREYCAAFNRVTPDDPSVCYNSYAATTTLTPFTPLAFPNWIINNREGENDGLVSLDSARWGQFKGTVHCDHWDLVPSKFRVFSHRRRLRNGFDHVHFYQTVVTELAKQGF